MNSLISVERKKIKNIDKKIYLIREIFHVRPISGPNQKSPIAQLSSDSSARLHSEKALPWPTD